MNRKLIFLHFFILVAPATNEPSTYATRLKSGTAGSVTTTGLNISPQAPAKSPSSPVRALFISIY